MKSDDLQQHISPEDLVDYFEEALSEEKEQEIGTHFANCEHCTKQARALSAFSHQWENWVEETQADAKQAHILRALAEAAEAHQEWKKRLKRWQTELKGLAEGAVKVVREAADQTAYIVTEGLEEMVHPDAHWQFDAAVTRGFSGTRLRTRGDTSPAKASEKQKIRRVQAMGESGARISVMRDGTVDINIDRTENQTPLLVLLIPLTGEGEVQVKELASSGSVLKTQFSVPESGDYVVIFEPIGRKNII